MGSQFGIPNIVLSCTFTGRNEVVAKVIFLLVSVILLTVGGGGVLSQHALQVVSQHALQQVSRGGVGIPAGFQAHTQGGSLGGSVRGGGLQAHTQGGS